MWAFLIGFVWFGLLFFTLCQHFNEECRYYHCLVPIKTERSHRFSELCFLDTNCKQVDKPAGKQKEKKGTERSFNCSKQETLI